MFKVYLMLSPTNFLYTIPFVLVFEVHGKSHVMYFYNILALIGVLRKDEGKEYCDNTVHCDFLDRNNCSNLVHS